MRICGSLVVSVYCYLLAQLNIIGEKRLKTLQKNTFDIIQLSR
jgi:hypothetical protein